MGQWDHARVQLPLAAWFAANEQGWNVLGSTEQRTRISSTRIRIPDLVLIRSGSQQPILSEPPVLVVEILSPDDTYSDLQVRSDEYRLMGVQTIWTIDPTTRSGRMCTGVDWVAAERLEVPGTPIYLELETLFAQVHTQAAPLREP